MAFESLSSINNFNKSIFVIAKTKDLNLVSMAQAIKIRNAQLASLYKGLLVLVHQIIPYQFSSVESASHSIGSNLIFCGNIVNW